MARKATKPESNSGSVVETQISGAPDVATRRVDWSLFGILFALLGMVLICHGSTLAGYFYADDFMHLPQLYAAFHGQPEVFWQNFVAPWAQEKDFYLFYRPITEVTIAVDYWLSGVRPMGYHITNLVLHFLCSVCVFFVARILAQDFNFSKSKLMPFFAASLFAVSPLNCEALAWLGARADQVSALLYACSFICFVWSVRKSSRILYFSAALIYLFCLFSKESSVSLPVAISVYMYLLSSNGGSFGSKVRATLKTTWPFFLLVLAYLIIRGTALGTISGGYIGSIGYILYHSILERWLLNGSYSNVFYPLNSEVFSENHPLRWAMRAFYIAAAMLCITSVPAPREKIRLVLFSFAWFFIALLPSFQSWDPAETMTGTRLLYLPAIPLAVAIAALLFNDEWNERTSSWRGKASIAILTLLVGCLAAIAFGNSMAWVASGNSVQKFHQQLQDRIAKLPPDKKLGIFNVIYQSHGCLAIVTSKMLHGLIQPPLSTPLYDRAVCLDAQPILSDIVLPGQLKELAADESMEFVQWDPELDSLKTVKLAELIKNQAQPINRTLTVFDAGKFKWLANYPGKKQMKVYSNSVAGKDIRSYFLIPEKPINPLSTDFIELNIQCSLKRLPRPVQLCLSWITLPQPNRHSRDRLVQFLKYDGRMHTYRIPVSDQRGWLVNGPISALRLDLPATHCILSSAKLLDGKNSIPKLWISSAAELKLEGWYQVDGPRAILEFDTTNIPRAESTVIEVSKKSYHFSQFTGTLRDNKLATKHCLSSLRIPTARGQFTLDLGAFPSDGYYQVRVFAISPNKKVVGYASDPLIIYVTKDQAQRSVVN